MTASEYKVLINNLIAEATDATIKKDDLRIGCFDRTWCLMHFTKSDTDNKTRPQGVVNNIGVHLTYIRPEDASELFLL